MLKDGPQVVHFDLGQLVDAFEGRFLGDSDDHTVLGHGDRREVEVASLREVELVLNGLGLVGLDCDVLSHRVFHTLHWQSSLRNLNQQLELLLRHGHVRDHDLTAVDLAVEELIDLLLLLDHLAVLTSLRVAIRRIEQALADQDVLVDLCL